MPYRYLYIFAIIIALSACASRTQGPSQEATASANANTKIVKSVDGSYSGEIVGTINPDSKFAKLKIGMETAQVHALIKAPDDMTRHETGKRWIPFYFGPDVQRIHTYYEGEGCLTYTGGNQFGGGGGQLIRITVDKTKTCMS